MTFNELAKWYMGLEKVKAQRCFWKTEMKLRQFNQIFGNKIIGKIKLADLENYQAKLKKQGLAPNTIDQGIGIIKTMIYKAFDNDLVGGDVLRAFKKVKKTLKKGTDVRDRILSPDEFEALMVHSPHYLKPIVATGYYTGMRRNEVLSLERDKVDLENRFIYLDADITKDDEARDVPICDELFKILQSIPKAIHTDHVFLKDGIPIRNFKKYEKGRRPRVRYHGHNRPFNQGDV